jgi:hypothetical protein
MTSKTRQIAEGVLDLISTSPAPTALNPIYGQQIVTTTKASPFNVINICGCTRVNYMGRDGNCDDTSKFSLGTATIALDTTNKTIGNNGIKITLTGTSGYMARSGITYSANKYYVIVADLKNGNATTGIYVGNNFATSATISDTTKFTTTGFRYTRTTDIVDFVTVGVFGTNTQFGYVDAIRMYEVSLADYNAFTGLTSDQIAAKYPYVDDVKHVFSPYIIRYGENLLPTFNEWTLHAEATAVEPYKLVITATGVNRDNLVKVPCSPSTTYTYTAPSNGQIALYVNNADGSFVTVLANTTQQVVTFTTGANAINIEAHVSNGALGAGTYTYTSPRLNIGAVDKGFKPRNDDYLFFPNTAIASSIDGVVYDQIFSRDGKLWRENRFVRDFVLDGSLIWSPTIVDFTGFKRLQVPAPSGILYTGSLYAVKYDGKILKQDSSVSASGDLFTVDPAPTFYVTIADIDSGWGDSYTPIVGEIQAYFWGYKMYNGASGNGATSYTGAGGETKAWVSLNPATGTWNAGSGVSVLPTTNYGTFGSSVYKPYKLTYQLATSTPEEIPFEGSISTLEDGNQFEVGNGMIVREKANPSFSAVYQYYFINIKDGADANVPNGNQLKNRANKIVGIYKNGKIDTWNWEFPSSNAYGNVRAQIKAVNFDTTATYEVTYLPLDEYLLSANVQTINGEYDSNIKMVVDRLAQNLADVDTRISVVENNKARKVQGQWIVPTLLNGWINYTSGSSTTPVSYFKDDFGFVHLRGFIKNGTATQGTVFFILPIGYRPLISLNPATVSNNNGTDIISRVGITASGDVNIQSGANTFFSLDGISFLAEQ